MKILSLPVLLLVSVASLLSLSANAAAPEPKKCASNDECSKEEFCDTSPKCQDGKNSGICMIKPQFCTMDYIPVKGCDGKVYSNRCQAQSEGQPITGLEEQTK